MNDRRHRVARLLIAVGGLLFVMALVLPLFDPGGPQEGGFSFFFALPGLVFFAVGGVLALRRAENAVGWLCLAIGLLWLLAQAQFFASIVAANAGSLGLASWLGGGLAQWWLPAVGLMATHLPLRLPNGSLPSARWRWYARFCTFVIVLSFVLVVTAPSEEAGQGVSNPLETDAFAFLTPLFVLFPLSFIGAIASVVMRYRRADGVQRAQLRWIALGGVVCIGGYIVTLVIPMAFVTAGEGDALANLTFVLYTAIPLAIAVAVLRYRLYDIDVVINRALVYTALTATLVATYLGSILLLQLVLSGVTADNGLAIAGSTLAVAALFQPVRARIQAAVDRRFYRRKYDAVRTLQQFGAHLRDEVDLDTLGGELRAVVADTMQPAHVSLWLRSEGGR